MPSPLHRSNIPIPAEPLVPVAGRIDAAPDWRAWCRDHVVFVAAVVFFIVLAFVFLRKPEKSEWNVVFVRAAHRMQAGEPIHIVEQFAYAYPPAMAMLTIPFAQLPLRGAIVAWYLVNIAATVMVFRCAWRLAGGPPLTGLSRPWLAILVLGMLLCLRFFITPLEHRQFDMVIAALLFAGCCRVAQGRDLSGAMLLGVSAAMKCTPLLFAPYLVWRRKFRAAATLVAVAAGVNLLPDLFWPQASGRIYMADWTHSFLSVAVQAAPGQWFVDWLQNQSLSAMFMRWSLVGLPWNPTADMEIGALSAAAQATLRAVVHGTELLLLAITAWQMGSARWLTASSSQPNAGSWETSSAPRWGIEMAAILCLMLLLSPMTSKAHLVIMILPSLLIARNVVEGRHAGFRWVLLPLLLFGPLNTRGLLGRQLANIGLAWGFPVWFVLISLGTMWWMLSQDRARTAARSQPRAAPGALARAG